MVREKLSESGNGRGWLQTLRPSPSNSMLSETNRITNEPLPTVEKIANPVLFDEHGIALLRLSSASILQFKSDHKQLQTAPALLPNDFPFEAFASKCAPGLLLEGREPKGRELKFKVRLEGTMLVLTDEVNGKGTGRKRRHG
jgi:hypothetical protein